MNIKVDFDNIVVKEEKNDFNVKVLMLKGEKGDAGDGENNVIEEVQVNGTALPVTNKAVNVTVPIVDSTLSSSSTNPVQNKVINNALNTKVDNSTLNNYYQISQVDNLLSDKADVSTVNSDIANETTARTNADTNLQNQITSLASGSPLVASSTAGMTDTTKVYVNTTDGNWYYYDGDSWEIGGTYQATGISETDPIIEAIQRDIEEISEPKENMFTTSAVQVGKNWTGGSATNRAVEYVAVKPNTKYTAEMLDLSTFTQIDLLEKATNTGSGSILVNNNITPASPKKTITTSANTNYICLQFQKSSTIEAGDFSNNTIIIFEGETPLYGANDKTARKEILDAITPFDTFKELANSRLKGEHRFADYNMRTCISTAPYVYEHTQEAHQEPYYNVTQTLKQYYQTSQLKLTKNICNSLRHEDVDFTPANNGYTRIIVGKNSDDLFFVSYVASDRKGQFGDGKYDKLEVTSDFINFRTILRGSLDNVETDGIVLPNMTNIKVVSVKEFSDGTYIVAVRCKDTTNNTDYTHFYRMNVSMTEINHCRYTNFNNEVVDMVDEFMGDVYDWHIFVSGNKALVTTYGNRNPETDRGRVWYTENCGYSWKQVFETANHLPEGVNAHTHGVMIDDYTGRLYVIVGENYSSIWYSDLGYNTGDNSWTKIDLTDMPCYNFQTGSQIVNGYPFRGSVVFGSDNEGIGAIYRFNKLDDGNLSYIEPAHEFLPNKYNGTFYCTAELSRKNSNSPLFICETHENCMLTEENNELLNQYHKARVVATMDGVHIVEIWTDDTFGEREVYINKNATTRRYSMCTRGMNFWLLKNGNAVMKFSGRDYQYFGGNPMFSVVGNTGDSCKVRIFYNLEKYI